MPRGRRVRRNEREHGSGSIKDLPNGDARAWKPPQPDGKRPSKLFHPPDARAKAEAWLKGVVAGPSMTLALWCELWFTRRKPTLDEKSVRRYADFFAMLAPLSDRMLATLTVDDWQDLINLLIEGDPSLPKEQRVIFARGTIRRAKSIWSGVITAAVRAGHLRENTLLDVKLGREDDKVPRAWRSDEQQRLIAAAVGEEHEAWLHGGLATGMRFEELRQLEIYDIDLVRLTVLVRTSKGGKSRLIPIPPEAAAIVAARIKRLQPGARLAFGHPDGTAYGENTFRRWLKDLCKRAKVSILPPHSMRHTYASNCIADSVDLAALAHDLGHSDIAVTARVYAHYITQRERPTARAISRRLYGAADPGSETLHADLHKKRG